MKQFILPLCLSDLLLYFLLLHFEYPGPLTIPQNTKHKHLSIFALAVSSLECSPTSQRHMPPFLIFFKTLPMSLCHFHIDFSAPCCVPDFLYAFLYCPVIFSFSLLWNISLYEYATVHLFILLIDTYVVSRVLLLQIFLLEHSSWCKISGL